MLAGLAALALAVLTPANAVARPQPGARAGSFRLFARSLGAITINRVYCGLSATGQICVDSTNSSTIGGGYWPKGTADQYIFNTGLQLAGVVGGDKSTNPWGGDTTGAFFFDPKGTTEHGEAVTDIYNSQNPSDFANWPGAAYVQNFPFYADVFHGEKTLSQGDVWWLAWDGDPANNAGRPHPLGVLVEQRGLGWNYPAGNQDILYFVYTFYNITSLNQTDYVNAGVPDSILPTLMAQAQLFHDKNNAAFGISLPAGGYSIDPLFAAFGTDMDVGSAGVNYASVNLPFALGFTYQQDFGQPAGWSFDPAIFGPPFFAGVGFAGVKYLKSPTGAGEIQLYSNTINGGTFGDPGNTTQLFRYLSGGISQAAGDAPCSYNPVTTHVCYVNNGNAADMRFFQSSTGLSLPPGGFGSIVVAYIFAAPVATAGYTPGTNVKPGNPVTLDTVAQLEAGNVNLVDKLTGFLSFNDANGDGIPQQSEFKVVNGSLLGKSLVAQAVFDNNFLLPQAPATPDFFLVPGDNQVTVLWQKSSTENTGDVYFNVASQPLNQDGTVNPLYDPNYRQYDVEGYRVYRGRVDSPGSLELLAQFDYAGTTITDYYGLVNPTTTCAPELGVGSGDSCPFDAPQPGVAPTTGVDYPLVGDVVQTKIGGRFKASGDTTVAYDYSHQGTPLALVDTAVVGNAAGYPPLSDTRVPFVYVDHGVRNYFRYFYSVTAFDINSFSSGPSSIESARVTKPVTPAPDAANVQVAGQTQLTFLGRGQALDTSAASPTIDPVTGIFSGPFPPANGWKGGLGAFVASVVAQPGTFTIDLDSIQLGSAYDGIPVQYWFSTSAPGVPPFALSLTQPSEVGVTATETQFPAFPVNGALAGKFGGSAQYALQGSLGMFIDGPDYQAIFGRGCVNGRSGFAASGTTGCEYNGPRWFDGPSPANNETQADPNAGNPPNFSSTPMTNYNNSGALTGVVTIFRPGGYESYPNTWRNVEGVLSGAVRAADFNVYWGTGGLVDSVIDVTHNVAVPFAADHMGGTWGILNPAAATPAAQSADGVPALTAVDFQCVQPLLTYGTGFAPCSAAGTPYLLSQTAEPGPVAFFSGGQAADPTTAVTAPNAGFGMYLAGHVFIFELAGGQVPAAGQVWSMRSYIGGISGGHGSAGDRGPYKFSNPEKWRTLSAVGTRIQVAYSVTNRVVAAADSDLSRVHTVPDPYYVTSAYEQTTDRKIIKFVNLPQKAIIRIYSSSGILVAQLENPSNDCQNIGTVNGQANQPINPNSGECDWNVRNRNNQVVASGVYFYHIESGDARKVGRFTVVNFAQ